MAKRRGNYARRNGGGVYRYTPKRKAALARAQRISAQKRKRRNANITKGVLAGATLAGVGAAAIYGYHNRSTIARESKVLHNRVVNAVQPGSKERVRLANAIVSSLSGKPTKKTPATNGAKTMSRSNLDAIKGRPNGYVKDTTAFPKKAEDAKVVDQLIERSSIPYNVDKFLPKGVKGLVFGKRVTGNAASRATAVYAENAGKIKGHDVNASAILHDMVADGEVTRVVLGKENKRRKAAGKDPLPTPRSGRTGHTRKPKAKQTLESKAFDQWLKDFGDS